MNIKQNPSKIRIFGERDFWVNGIIGAISLSSIVPFYLDVLIKGTSKNII